MRTFALLLATIIAACSNEAEQPPGPALPDPGDDLLIVFEQEVSPGNCAMFYTAYVKADAAPGLVRLSTDMIIDDGYIGHGGGLGMQDLIGSGILKGGTDTFGLTREGKTCDQVKVQIRSIQCKASGDTDIDCPPLRLEGTEQFAMVFEKPY
ncbi:MAG: hypothetical protein AAF221_14970 [Pseudomonadota bacterium]